MIAAIVLATSGPADFGSSPLVSPPHSHEWALLGQEDSGRIWWDRNAIRSHSIEGRQYPTILMRVVANQEHWVSELFQYQDIVTAVDCDNAEIAEIDEVRNGQRAADPWAESRPGPEFSPLPDQEAEEIQEMMQVVCGEGRNQ